MTQTSDLLATAERRAFVLRARKAGATYAEIAAAAIEKFGVEQLPRGYDKRYAYKDVKRELDALREEIGEDAQAVLTLELQRLDDLLKGVWNLAARKNPDYKAFDRVLRVMERRARLLGLDAAQEHRLSGADGGPIQVEDVNETRRRLLADLEDEVASAESGAAAGMDSEA
jgi:hypothetical protein